VPHASPHASRGGTSPSAWPPGPRRGVRRRRRHERRRRGITERCGPGHTSMHGPGVDGGRWDRPAHRHGRRIRSIGTAVRMLSRIVRAPRRLCVECGCSTEQRGRRGAAAGYDGGCGKGGTVPPCAHNVYYVVKDPSSRAALCQEGPVPPCARKGLCRPVPGRACAALCPLDGPRAVAC
jgi:hypothetical protein